MTDSMKFGPEWLRNMSSDAPITGATYQNSNLATGNSAGGAANNITQQNNTNTAAVTPVPRNLFPEFRYGREEMLMLFDKNCEPPEILATFKNLYVERVQCPLALTPSVEEDMPTFSGVPGNSQKLTWVQRSPIGFNTSNRNGTRSSTNDRGRIRGKPMYHSTFQRSTVVFEDDGRSAPLKSDRNWLERNGGGAGENMSTTPNLDWSSTPTSSPRREYMHQSKNIENWRCNRNEESLSSEASVCVGGSGGDGWRAYNNTSTNRWGRSTSWRDEDLSAVNNDTSFGSTSGNSNNSYMQRSFSTTSNPSLESKGASQSSTPSASNKSSQNSTTGLNASEQSSHDACVHYPDGNTNSATLKRNCCLSQWTINDNSVVDNITSAHDTSDEQSLPEWAMENAAGVGGTFDATGAFHGGGSFEDSSLPTDTHPVDTLYLKKDYSSSITFSSSLNSDSDDKVFNHNHVQNKGKENISSLENVVVTKKDEFLKECNADVKIDLSALTQKNYKQSTPDKNKQDNAVEPEDKHFRDVVAISENSPQMSSVNNSDSNKTLCNEYNLPDRDEKHKNENSKDFSDSMMQVADDMIEKLIMDDEHANKLRDTKNNSINTSAASTMLNMDLTDPLIYQQQRHLSPIINATKSLNYNMGQCHNQQVLQQQQHMRQLQILSGEDVGNGPSLGLTPNVLPHTLIPNMPTDFWFYRDPQGRVQGPFSAIEMTEWYRAGYFNENLYVRRICDVNYRSLGELLKICNGHMPFTNSHLIPIDSNPLSNTQNMLSSTVCADTTSHASYAMKDVHSSQNETTAALKNLINPMGMSNLLNTIQYNAMPDRYLCGQDVEIPKNNEFLSMHEREALALINQKSSLQMTAMPEIINTLNPVNTSVNSNNSHAVSENNQMYDLSADCTKTEHQTLFNNQQSTEQPLESGGGGAAATNTYIDTNHSDYMFVGTPTLVSPQKAEFNAIGFSNSAKQGQTAGTNEIITNDILNDINLRMILRGGNNSITERPAITTTNSTNSQNFLSNQEIFGRAGVSSQQHFNSNITSAPSAQNPMVQMWMNQLNSANPNVNNNNNNAILHMTNTACQNSINPLTLNNQWNGGPLVGMPNTLINNVQVDNFLGLPKSTGSTSIWDVNILEQHVQMQQQQQHKELKEKLFQRPASPVKSPNTNNYLVKSKPINYDSNDEDTQQNVYSISDVKLPKINTGKSEVQESLSRQQSSRPNNNTSSNNKKQRKVDVLTTQSTGSFGKRGNNNKTQYVNSADVLNNVEISKTSDEVNRHIDNQLQQEDKGKQKEEKKRNQQQEPIHDDKCRLDTEEYKDHQNQCENKENSNPLPHHRRKMLLTSNNAINENGLLTTNTGGINQQATFNGVQPNIQKSQKEQMHSSIAPWSQTQVNANAGLSLVEIQKAERRERRVDRQMEIQEKRALAAAATNDNLDVLKWNSPSVPVKSLNEIQAEEAKRVLQAQAELQRRKEKDRQDTGVINTNSVIGTNGNSNTLIGGGSLNFNNPGSKNIWNGGKVWGSTVSIWEETNWKKSANAYSSIPTTASIVAQCPPLQQQQKTKVNQSTNAPNNGIKVLKKSQTTSNAEMPCQKKLSSPNNKMQLSSTSASATGKNAKQNRNQKAVCTEKKNPNSGANIAGSKSQNSTKSDDYEAEFINWCTKSLNNMETKVDVPTFVTFLRDLESPYEVKDYVRVYLGENKEFTDFAKQFLERRSKYKNLQRAQNAHNDDLCKPAQAITPSHKQRKVKKNKMTKLDANILGFSVTAAEGRINVGDRDYVDAP